MNLFQLWNKTFSNDKSLKYHQRSKYCSKNNKSKEYWAQKEEEFRGEETREFLDYNTIDTISYIKRAPYGVLEEFRSDNLEELNIDELQFVYPLDSLNQLRYLKFQRDLC